MNTLFNMPEAQAIRTPMQPKFAAIGFDYLYPIAEANGQVCWVFSQDLPLQPNLILCWELAEKFVERVAKSTELPFLLDRSWTAPEKRIKKSQLGALFYQLITLLNGCPDNFHTAGGSFPYSLPFRMEPFDRAIYRYEPSESLKIFYSVACHLYPDGIHFTGNPAFMMGPVAEGELINGFVLRLREAMKGQKFKQSVKERKKTAIHNFNASKRYLERLYDQCPGLSPVRLFLGYPGLQLSFTVIESDRHFMRLVDHLREDFKQKTVLGWWWKMEYMTEVGYRYHLVIFFDGLKINPQQGLMNYCTHWSEVTGDRGISGIPFVPEWGYQPVGQRFYQTPAFDSKDSLLRSINRMFMRDIHMRLPLNKQQVHWGMGPRPKWAEHAGGLRVRPGRAGRKNFNSLAESSRDRKNR